MDFPRPHVFCDPSIQQEVLQSQDEEVIAELKDLASSARFANGPSFPGDHHPACEPACFSFSLKTTTVVVLYIASNNWVMFAKGGFEISHQLLSFKNTYPNPGLTFRSPATDSPTSREHSEDTLHLIIQ